ncbi:MAG: branched-chain amino acid ABC transporter permease [Aigarchaeota archaeon]|nr:branched-chain amino acid ABC transporter permease [Candidatus Pelearchaeum maunauluense]
MDLTLPLLNSLALGSLYTLMALGLTITFSVTRIPNFAHAELVTVGGYVTAVLVNFMAFPPYLALLSAFIASAILALGMDELVFKPLYKRGSRPLFLLVASIGVGLIVRYTLFSLADATGNITIQTNVSVNPIMRFGRAYITMFHAIVIPVTIAIVIILHILFHYTLMGKALRAISDNEDLARVSGIRIYRLRRVAWLIAGGAAGLAGGLWSISLIIDPNFGWDTLLRIFASSILGGLTSFWGTIIGGYIVGFAENMGIATLNTWFGINTAYRPLISFTIIVAVFLIRPRGFAGIDVRSIMSRLVVSRPRS